MRRNINIWSVVVFLIGFLTFFSIKIAGLNWRGGPVLVTEGEVFDLGIVPAHSSVEKSFRIGNAGKQPLKLSGFKTNGCSIYEYPGPVIQPKKHGKVTLVVKTKSPTDRLDAWFAFETNDPQRPFLEFQLKTKVEYTIAALPPRINYGEVLNESEPLVKYIQILSQDAVPFSIQDVEIKNSNVSDPFLSVIQMATDTLQISLQSQTIPLATKLSADISVKTDYPGIADVTIPVRAVVRGPLEVYP